MPVETMYTSLWERLLPCLDEVVNNQEGGDRRAWRQDVALVPAGGTGQPDGDRALAAIFKEC